jgi:hypothetical protein
LFFHLFEDISDITLSFGVYHGDVMEFQQYYTSPGSTFSQSSTDHSSPEGNQSASENQSYSGANFVEGNMLQTVPGNFYATASGV